MIDAYAKAGDNEVAECWLQQMVANGFHPDRITYVTLLRGCTHMSPDVDVRWTYGAIIKAYVHVGNLSAVKRWLGEVTKAGFKPSRALYEEMLNICLSRNLKDLASEISTMMAKNCAPRPAHRGQQQNHQQAPAHMYKGVSMAEISDKLNMLSVENLHHTEKNARVLSIRTPPGLDAPPGLEKPMVHIEHLSL